GRLRPPQPPRAETIARQYAGAAPARDGPRAGIPRPCAESPKRSFGATGGQRMRRWRRLVLVMVCVTATALSSTAVAAPAPRAAPALGILPSAPRAAFRPEPALPVPHGWPFAEAFPRTSGTG